MMSAAGGDGARTAGFNAFISYATDPDYRTARRLQAYLELLHRQHWFRAIAPQPLRIFRDGNGISLSAGQAHRNADGVNNAIFGVLDQYLADSEFLIVLCSGGAVRSAAVSHEVGWFLANRPAGRILLAVTEGTEPSVRPEEVFPEAVRQAGLHQLSFVDLRAWRGRAARGWKKVRDIDDELVRIPAALLESTAGRVYPSWERERARRHRLQRLAVLAAALLGTGALSGYAYTRTDQYQLRALVSDVRTIPGVDDAAWFGALARSGWAKDSLNAARNAPAGKRAGAVEAVADAIALQGGAEEALPIWKDALALKVRDSSYQSDLFRQTAQLIGHILAGDPQDTQALGILHASRQPHSLGEDLVADVAELLAAAGSIAQAQSACGLIEPKADQGACLVRVGKSASIQDVRPGLIEAGYVVGGGCALNASALHTVLDARLQSGNLAHARSLTACKTEGFFPLHRIAAHIIKSQGINDAVAILYQDRGEIDTAVRDEMMRLLQSDRWADADALYPLLSADRNVDALEALARQASTAPRRLSLAQRVTDAAALSTKLHHNGTMVRLELLKARHIPKELPDGSATLRKRWRMGNDGNDWASQAQMVALVHLREGIAPALAQLARLHAGSDGKFILDHALRSLTTDVAIDVPAWEAALSELTAADKYLARDIRVELAAALLTAGRLQEAAATYRAADDGDINLPLPLWSPLQQMVKQHQVEAALGFTPLIEKRPDIRQQLESSAVPVLVALGRAEEAERIIQERLHQPPDQAGAWLAMADAHTKLGRQALAQVCIQTAARVIDTMRRDGKGSQELSNRAVRAALEADRQDLALELAEGLLEGADQLRAIADIATAAATKGRTVQARALWQRLTDGRDKVRLATVILEAVRPKNEHPKNGNDR